MESIFNSIKPYLTLKYLLIFLAWLIPIIISIFALHDSRRALKISERETLLVQVANNVPGIPQPFPDYQVSIRSIVKTNGKFSPDLPPRDAIEAVLVDNYWSCLISNLGNRTVSLVAFEIWRDEVRDLESSGFFEIPDKPVDLPISVAPGESKRLLLRIPVKLSDQAIDVLYRQDRLINPLKAGEIFGILQEAGIDHYGNHVRLVPLGGAHVRFDVDTEHAYQEKFELKVKTGMGKYFSDKFSWYKLPKF